MIANPLKIAKKDMSVNATILLASTSIYRKALLEKLTRDFIVCKPDVDETPLPNETPLELVRRLAIAKAKAGADQCGVSGKILSIGSDQIALFNQEILGKPHTPDNAFAQLTKFSGHHVQFLTGLAVYDSISEQVEVIVEPFSVYFRTLTAEEIWRYIEREQPLHCAGSFKSEGLGITLFEKFEGQDPNSLIGLPLIRLHAMLKHFGVDLLLRAE